MVSWRIRNQNLREFFAEFLGTCTLVCLGCAGNAVVTLNNQGGSVGLITVPILWGLSLTVAIYVCGGVSGGHLNPAVTLGMATVGKLPWSKVLNYFAAQYLGAFFGSLLTFLVYRESIIKLDDNKTMGIFGTFMRPDITVGTALIDQIICTAFFLLIICAITDERNMAVPKGLIPIAIGFADIGVLHISFGYNCGTPLNPARDLSPRIMSAIVHWGGEVFSYRNYSYFWVPIVACHVGGVIGCWLYRIMIENHWAQDSFDSYTHENDNNNTFNKEIRITASS